MQQTKKSDLTFVQTLPTCSFLNKTHLDSSACRAIYPKRRRTIYRTPDIQIPVCSLHFLEPVHTLPEFINHLVVSCGIGLAGIAGAKATEGARALTAGDRKADRMDQLARDIDSRRRRKELANIGHERNWNDVGVDRYANVFVEPEIVPEIESHDDLEAFDKLLMDSPAAKRFSSQKEYPDINRRLPDPTEFECQDED